MMALRPSFVSSALAYALAFYAANVFKHSVDIFRIPVPLSLGGISSVSWIPLAILAVLVPRLMEKPRNLLLGVDALLYGTLILWGLLEWLHASKMAAANFYMINASFSAALAYSATRAHLLTFRDATTLATALVHVIAALAVTHFLLLVMITARWSLPFVDASEVIGRNGISMLLVVAVFITLCVRRCGAVTFTPFDLFLLIGVCGQLQLVDARGALLCLFAVVSAWYVSTLRTLSPITLFTTRLATVAVIFAVAGVSELTAFASAGANVIPGSSDNYLSTLYRIQTNHHLLSVIMENPLLGVGFAETITIRSGEYISHTLYLTLLAAYGVVGCLPIALILMGTAYQPDRRRLIAGNIAIFLIFAVTSFVNDPLLWIGMALALVTPLSPLETLKTTFGLRQHEHTCVS